MPKLALLQPRLFRGGGDVAAEGLELFDRADEMVEASQFVSVAIEFQQAVADDLRQLWPLEHARAVAGIQAAMPAIGETPHELALQLGFKSAK